MGLLIVHHRCIGWRRIKKFEKYEDENEPALRVPTIEDTIHNNGNILSQKPAYEKILHYEVSLQLLENMTIVKVTKHAIGLDRSVARTYNDNLNMISMIYEVLFTDVQIKEYTVNVIAQNMLDQVDYDCYSLEILREFIGYWRDKAVAIFKDDIYTVTSWGNIRRRKNNWVVPTIKMGERIRIVDSLEGPERVRLLIYCQTI